MAGELIFIPINDRLKLAVKRLDTQLNISKFNKSPQSF